MNPYDASHALAKALRESSEYTSFQEARDALKGDQSARNMLVDFRTQQFNLQKQKLSGLEIAPEQEDKLEKLFQVISLNLTLKHFMEAEYRLNVLLQDVQNIIAEVTGDLFDPELFGLPDMDDFEETEES